MTSETPASFWRKCTTCKKAIGFYAKYWICSVSTCNRQRTGLVFCSVACFDAHIPVLNHRDAGAFERRAPTEGEWKLQQEPPAAHSPAQAPAQAPSRPSAPAPKPAPGPSASPQSPSPDEILVVVSKVKDYIRRRSGMNTSDAVMRRLSTWVMRWCADSVRRAKADGRSTVLDRDLR